MLSKMKTEHEDQTDEEFMLDETIQTKEDNEDSDENEFVCDGRIDLFQRLRFRLSSKNTYDFPHHIALSLNSHDDFINLDNIEEVYKPLAYCDSYPKPYSSCADPIDTVDQCLQLISDKKSWNTKVLNFQINYKRLRKNKKFDRISSKKSKITIPLYLYNFTKLLQKDPDPYFDSHYNWYFCGNGNLCAVDFDEKKYILYSTRDTLYVQQFSDSFNNRYECKHTSSNKQMIFETVSITFDNRLMIGLRQKYRIFLIELVKKSDSLTLEHFKTIKSDVPFVSFFIGNSVDTYYTCSNGSVYVYNAITDESSILFNSGSKEIVPDNWSSIRHYNRDVLIHTNDNSINILDKRDNDVKKISIAMLKCERISASQSSAFNPDNIYVSSYHNVLLYDLKYTKKDGFRKQWSHGLKSSPMFMCTSIFNRDELINLSSQLFVDSCMIVNSYESEKNMPGMSSFQQTTYPWHPHSIQDSWKKVLLKGICLDPTLNVRNRINVSRCGSLFLKDENKLNLYNLNSIGDIFVQNFTEIDHPTNTEEFYDKFSQWGEFLSTKASNGLFVSSSIIDMTEYQVKMKSNDPVKVRVKPSTDLLTSKRHWNNYIDYFSRCTDLCAQELLDMWGLKDEDDSQIPNESKVESWMVSAMERDL